MNYDGTFKTFLCNFFFSNLIGGFLQGEQERFVFLELATWSFSPICGYMILKRINFKPKNWSLTSWFLTNELEMKK